MFQLLLATVLMGQGICVESVSQPMIVSASPASEIVEYRTGGEPIKTSIITPIYYGDKLYSVPVINGYAPILSIRRLENGGKYTVCDYQKKIPYMSCKQPKTAKKETPKWKESPQELTPIPDTNVDKPVSKPTAPALDVNELLKTIKTGLEAAKANAPKIEISIPTESMISPLPSIPENDLLENKMMSPLPPLPAKEIDTRPKAPTVDILPMSVKDEDLQPPTTIPAPKRVMKPTYK
jgi:hypothetical protein